MPTSIKGIRTVRGNPQSALYLILVKAQEHKGKAVQMFDIRRTNKDIVRNNTFVHSAVDLAIIVNLFRCLLSSSSDGAPGI